MKGFAAVHIVKKDDSLELWIGEAKFYKDITAAIRKVSGGIIDHLKTDYLKSEFILIKNKIDPSCPESDLLKKLLSENISLDEIFKRACIPVLLTYESAAIQSSNKADQEYINKINKEVSNAYKEMRKKLNEEYEARFKESLPLTVHVILIPLKEKQILIDTLHVKLKAMQARLIKIT